MKLTVKNGWIKELLKHGKNEYLDNSMGYGGDERFVEIQADRLSRAELNRLYAIADRLRDAESKAEGLARKISTFIRLAGNPSSEKVGKLELLVVVGKQYIGKSPNKWLFTEKEDGQIVPYYVSRIEYEPPDKFSPAHTKFSLTAFVSGEAESDSITFYAHDLQPKKTVVELLNKKGYYLETPAALETHLAEIKAWEKLSGQCGQQFTTTGYAFRDDEDKWNTRLTPMEVEGLPAKVVLDDIDDDKKRDSNANPTTSTRFWSRKKGDDDYDDDSEEGSAALPIHPYLSVFSLRDHTEYQIHVNNLAPYVYQPELMDKLILPDDHKNLISILIQSSRAKISDIITGKSSGVIVISTGAPGTGKTLTAEVASEFIERPLYVVQCSQLGTDEEKIEKELQEVLARATRWGAILLIDEADVYIRHRGEDIQQNAIVGVFLRVLEYYRGILFLTSNREVIIDDAIMSRATAWIRYERPATVEALTQIWQVLSKQIGVTLPAKEISKLIERFKPGTLSGRTVLKLLTLALKLSEVSQKKVGAALIEYVSRYQKLDGETDS
jgi:hypothetical protein